MMDNSDYNSEFEKLFFSPVRMDSTVDLSYKSAIPHAVNALKASTNINVADTCCFVFDYYERVFVYVDKNFLNLSGYASNEIENKGITFMEKIVYSEDLRLLYKCNKLYFDFYYQEPVDTRDFYIVSFDIRVILKEGEVAMWNIKILPLFSDHSGNLILGLGQIESSAKDQPGNIQIFSIAENRFMEYDPQSKKLEYVKQRKLSEMEKKVIRLMAKGLTGPKIQETLSIKTYTLNYYKRSIKAKLGVKSSEEAVYEYFHNGGK